MHKIIQLYYDGVLSKAEMLTYYLLNFKSNVSGNRPKESIVASYIESGKNYLINFKPFPFNTVAVEERINFQIDGIPFVGIIDYLGEKDGEYYIVDNKSRKLKPRSKREKPTINDLELDEMFKQLYIYSEAVKQKYGKYPVALCFNCFLNGNFIVEEFSEQKFEDAKSWIIETIHKIENSESFDEEENVFACSYLCGVHDDCEYYIESQRERRRGHY